MTIYLFVFIVLAGIAILSELHLTRRARLMLLASSYLLIVLFVGLRWQTGNDWTNYHEYYIHANNLHDSSDPFEIGFRIANVLSRSAELPYSGFLLLYSAIFIGLMVLSFDEDDFSMAGWLLLLFYSSFLVAWMGTSRQIMAIGICLYSIRFILGGNWLKFILCISVAACFHTTAVCFLLAWPLARINLTLRTTWIILGLLAVAATLNLGTVLIHAAGNRLGLPYFSQMLAIYGNPDDSYVVPKELSAMFYLKRLAFLLWFIFWFRFFRTDRDKLYFKLYLVSVVIFILLFGAIPMIPLRAGIYFGIAELFVMALFTRRIKHPVWRSLYCTGLVLLCFVRLWTTLYVNTPKILIPYKAIIYNQDVYRNDGWF